MRKIVSFFVKIFKVLYKILDKLLVTPISRFIYFVNKKRKNNPIHLEKFLTKPGFLVYASLALAILIYLLVDSQVINLVETEAEILSNEPVRVIYNKENYVVEGLIDSVDIILTGRKSSLYLAKQLGSHEVVLDLSNYGASETPIRVPLSYNQTVGNISYKLDPAYVSVIIRKKISKEVNASYELLNEDKLNEKFSVSNVELDQTTVIVKGSQDELKKIAAVKALIDLSNNKYSEAITYEVDNLPLVAYDSEGNRLNTVEIVPSTISASITFSTYKANVPIEVTTIGELVAGKSIASITINGQSNHNVDIYGEKSDIESIRSVPVTIDVTGKGTGGAQTYNASIKKPTGVRSISESEVKIIVTFGDEKQKTINISNIRPENLASGLTVNRTNDNPISVQVKGVQSIIDSIDETSITAYIDLTDYRQGTYDVTVNIDNVDPRVSFVVTDKVNIVVSGS